MAMKSDLEKFNEDRRKGQQAMRRIRNEERAKHEREMPSGIYTGGPGACPICGGRDCKRSHE